jgi:hypothetical protein
MNKMNFVTIIIILIALSLTASSAATFVKKPVTLNITVLCIGADPLNITDSDGDGVMDQCDNCPAYANPDQADSDNDTVGDVCDNCWYESNPGQGDSDANCQLPPYGHDPQCGDVCENIIQPPGGGGAPLGAPPYFAPPPGEIQYGNQSETITIISIGANETLNIGGTFPENSGLHIRSIIANKVLINKMIKMKSLGPELNMFPYKFFIPRFDKVAYSFFEFTSDLSPSEITEITFDLRVTEVWIDKNGILEDTVTLYYFDNGVWKPAETTYLKTENGYLYYKAKLKSIYTIYAIGGKHADVYDVLSMIDKYFSGEKTIQDVMRYLDKYYSSLESL